MEKSFIGYKKGDSKLVLTMPHSATVVPEGLKHNVNLEDEVVKRTVNGGVDLCVPFVTEFHEQEKHARIWSEIPRAILDMHRLSTDLDYKACEGKERGKSDPHGLVWIATVENDPSKMKRMLKKPYSLEELESLISNYHEYVGSINQAMRNAKSKHGMAIQFDLHSMPARIPGLIKEGEYKNGYLDRGPARRGIDLSKGELPDLILLDKGDQICDPAISEIVMTIFREYGLSIGKMLVRAVDTPSAYSLFANKQERKYCLGVEIVGHTFEPKRTEGELVYDPTDVEKYTNAFREVFSSLSNFEESLLSQRE
ncbi:MAG: N-formylglutamate amidohydrolase [Candidatus Nanoarchaeia archaeon]